MILYIYKLNTLIDNKYWLKLMIMKGKNMKISSIYDYNNENGVTTYIHYHIVFCPRYKRRIFKIPGLEKRFKQLILQKSAEIHVIPTQIICNENYVYMEVNVLNTTITPAAVVNSIKTATSRTLRNEFKELSKMPNLWTRNYFLSTENKINEKVVTQYVEIQKSRP